MCAKRVFFDAGNTRTYTFRRQQLLKLSTAIQKHETAILEALQRDLRKPPFEGYAVEVGVVLQEIRYVLKNP